MSTPSIAKVAGLCMLLLAAGGCCLFPEEPILLDIDARTYPEDGYTAVQRVLVVPFSDEASADAQADLVDKAFAEDLAERGRFELVTIPRSEYPHRDAIELSRTGRFPLTALLDLARLYRVDAVILGTLKVYQPYSPPAIGIKADLISARTGQVLRTVNGLLDARDTMVSRDILRYFQEECGGKHDSLFQWRLITTSPRLYARYACNRFINAMYPETASVSAPEGGLSLLF